MGQKFILCAYEQRFFLCFTLCQMLIPSQTGIEKKFIFKDLYQPLQDPLSPPSWEGVQAGSPPKHFLWEDSAPQACPVLGLQFVTEFLVLCWKKV